MLKMYIVIIGKYNHNDFHPSYWNFSPICTTPYRIVAENVEEANIKALDYCKSVTESVNAYSEIKLENDNKNYDEFLFKVVDVYSVDSLEEIV